LAISVGSYISKYNYVKVGITRRDPYFRFNEHLANEPDWERMVVLYESDSNRNPNTLEDWLVDRFKDKLYNFRAGGGSNLSAAGKYYLYLLLA